MSKNKEKQFADYLPLTESGYYILLTLIKPLHGYAMMQEIEDLSNGTVTIGPGTLYGAVATMEQAGLIELVREENRRKEYLLTAKGALVLMEQIKRFETMLNNGRNRNIILKSFVSKREVQDERNQK